MIRVACAIHEYKAEAVNRSESHKDSLALAVHVIVFECHIDMGWWRFYQHAGVFTWGRRCTFSAVLAAGAFLAAESSKREITYQEATFTNWSATQEVRNVLASCAAIGVSDRLSFCED